LLAQYRCFGHVGADAHVPTETRTGLARVALPVSNAMLMLPSLHEAVILVNQTPALAAPVPMSEPAFTLPEAETVSDRHEDYILVHTRSGQSGWVGRANLATVVP
jgi:hypothetical protein